MSIITQEERPLDLYFQNTDSVRCMDFESALEVAEKYTVEEFHPFNLNELQMDEALRIKNGVGPFKMTKEAAQKAFSFAKIPFSYVQNIDNQLIVQNFNDNILSLKNKSLYMAIKHYNDEPVVVGFCGKSQQAQFESNEQIIARFQNDPRLGQNLFDIHQSIYGLKLSIMRPAEIEILKDDRFKFGLDFNHSPIGYFSTYMNPSILRLICTNGARVTYGDHKTKIKLQANQTLDDIHEFINQNFNYNSERFVEIIQKSAENDINFPAFRNIIGSVDKATTNKELTNEVLKIHEEDREFIREKAREITNDINYEGKKTYDRKAYEVYNDVTEYARDLTDLFQRMQLQSKSFELILPRKG